VAFKQDSLILEGLNDKMIVTLPRKNSDGQIQAWSGYDAIELLRTNKVTKLILDSTSESDKVLQFLSTNNDEIKMPEIVGRELSLNSSVVDLSDHEEDKDCYVDLED
jgi:hypothetical protein